MRMEFSYWLERPPLIPPRSAGGDRSSEAPLIPQNCYADFGERPESEEQAPEN